MEEHVSLIEKIVEKLQHLEQNIIGLQAKIQQDFEFQNKKIN